MPGLEDIVPRVEIDTSDAEDALRHLGEVGAQAFSEIIDAASKGDFTGLATMVGGELAGAFVKAAESVIGFVDAQASAVETLSNLATATGMSLPALEGLKDAFASVGISTSGFERSIGRLAITIGSEWASIQQSVRTSGDSQERSMQSIRDAAERTQRAYRTLQEAGTHAAQSAAHDALSIREAQQNLDKAELKQRQDRPFFSPVDDASAKKRRQESEDQLAVDRAQQSLKDAQAKQIEDSVKANQALKDAINGIAKAKQAEREAGEKAHESDLKDLPKIAASIQQVADGTAHWADITNHAEISAGNLTKAMILAASKGTGAVPSVTAVYEEMSKVFSQMGNSAEEMNVKMEIVQHTMGAGFRAGQASAAQLLAVLERGPDALKQFQVEADKFSKSSIGLSPADADAMKEFNSQWAQLNSIIEQVREHMTAVTAVAITPFITAIKTAIEGVDEKGSAFGDLATLVSRLGSTLGDLLTAIKNVVGAIGTLMNLTPATFFGYLSAGITLVSIGLDGLRATLGGAVAGLGLLMVAAEKVLHPLTSFNELMKANPLYQAGKSMFEGAGKDLEKDLARLKEVSDAIVTAEKTGGSAGAGSAPAAKPVDTNSGAGGDKIAMAADKTNTAGDKIASGADTLSQAATTFVSAVTAFGAAIAKMAPAGGKAAGGHIRGPGGPTSDGAGLFALSDGEFVMRSAAVSHYGADLFGALNDMAVGGFATGGAVGGARGPSIPASGTIGGPSSILNLTIDGNHFDGLRAPESVAAKLKGYAVTRQSSATGHLPSWMR